MKSKYNLHLIVVSIIFTIPFYRSVAQTDTNKFDYGNSQILIDEEGADSTNTPLPEATEQNLAAPTNTTTTASTTSTAVRTSAPSVLIPNVEVEGRDNIAFYQTLRAPVDIIAQHKLVAPQRENYPLRSSAKWADDDGGKYQERLLRLQSIIPLEYNEMVGSFINMYINSKPQQVRQMLARADMYLPTITAALDRYQLPTELKYLPVVLSALIPSAQSDDGGSGLWQLSYKTASLYGLESTDLIDERRDPLLSSEAAARHLKNLHRKYKDWHLVIAAFCAGEGTLNKALQRSGKNRYWDTAPFMPLESQAYVPLFIAATYIMNNYEQHNLYKADISYAYYLTDTLRVQTEISLKAAAAHLNMSYEDLKFLNPAVKADIVPASRRGYPVVVPTSKVGILSSYLQTISSAYTDRIVGQVSTNLPLPTNSPLRKDMDEYGKPYDPANTNPKETVLGSNPNNPNQEVELKWKVQPDDELQYIAIAIGKTPEKIMEWNKLTDTNLQPGQVLSLYVPRKDEATIRQVIQQHHSGVSTTTAPKSPAKPQAKTATYSVKAGESLDIIANKFNTTVKAIKQYNGLKVDMVHIGQKLVIPIK